MGSQSGLLTCPRDGGTHQPPPHTPRLTPEGHSHLCSSSCREKMMQDAGLTYQQFKNCTDNLNAWLERLPHNKVRPSDGPSQIAYKLQAQKVRSWGCRECGPASLPASYPELSPQARPSSLAAFLTGRAACACVARPLVASVLMTSKLRPQRLCFAHHHPRHPKCYTLSTVAQTVTGLPTMRETWVQSLGREDLLEKEMATHSSILAWKIPWMEEPGV